MPLKRGGIVGYDADRMSYRFTMIHEARIIDCEISSAAAPESAHSPFSTQNISSIRSGIGGD